jgi:hypothetical protein
MKFLAAGVIVSGLTAGAFASEVPSVTPYGSFEEWSTEGPDIAGFAPGSFELQEDSLQSIQPDTGSSVSFTGGSSWWSWSMTSSSGALLDATNDRVASTVPGAGIELTLTGAGSVPGAAVHGIAGDFSLLSEGGLPQSGRLILALAGGDEATFKISAASAFQGFWTAAPVVITGITIKPDDGSTGLRVSIDNLYFGLAGTVPAPGAIVLLAAAGLVGLRRRR